MVVHFYSMVVHFYRCGSSHSRGNLQGKVQGNDGGQTASIMVKDHTIDEDVATIKGVVEQESRTVGRGGVLPEA
jgi:hypothetical protein